MLLVFSRFEGPRVEGFFGLSLAGSFVFSSGLRVLGMKVYLGLFGFFLVGYFLWAVFVCFCVYSLYT
jgi:hypothetical protein